MEAQDSSFDTDDENQDEEYEYSDDDLEYEKVYTDTMQQLTTPPIVESVIYTGQISLESKGSNAVLTDPNGYLTNYGAYLENLGGTLSQPKVWIFPIQRRADVDNFMRALTAPAPAPEENVIRFPGDITLEFVGQGRFGKMFLKDNSGSLDPYYEYIKTLKGNQVAPRKWEYSLNREKAVTALLNRIVTGQLLPPGARSSVEIPTTNISLDSIPVPPEDDSSPLTVVSETIPVDIPEPKTRVRPPVPSVQNTGTSVSAAQLVQSQMSVVPRAQGTPAVSKQLPKYDPTLKEPGESEERYMIRIANYNKLIGYGSQAADLISRVRNNVDFEGVEYSELMTKYIDAYLPKQ